MAPKQKYYAVADGREKGVYTDWNNCKSRVDGYSGARYKSFSTESEAQQFVNSYNTKTGSSNNCDDSNYFGNDTQRYGSGLKHDHQYKSPSVQQTAKNSNGFGQVVYTDGACFNNGKANSKAGYGVFWGKDNPNNLSEPLSKTEPQTNNRAEYTAVKQALNQASKNGLKEVTIRTGDLLEDIDKARNIMNVKFEHVAGHSGEFGNDMADWLANKGAAKRN